MIRSQSISYLSEKKKSGLFMSIIGRKSSSKDLNSHIANPRPLSQVADTLTNQSTTSKRKSMFVPSVAAENKENSDVGCTPKATRDGKIKNPALSMVKSRTTTFSSDKTIAGFGLDPRDNISIDTISVGSPLSQKTKVECGDSTGPDAIEYPSYLTNYVNKDDTAASKPAKLHRTVNLNAYKDLLKDLSRLPMGNRLSMEIEAQQLEEMRKHFKSQSDVKVKFVENAIFISFFEDEGHAAMRPWDQVDASLMSDEYDSDSKIYMYL